MQPASNHPGLFCFVGQAIASDPAPYRTGARHALLAFTTGDDADAARDLLDEAAEAHGWQHLRILQTKPLPNGARGIESGPLRDAAETALTNGASLVVWPDELPLDA
ncbi:hypothetical protein [Jannaschia aquimarina]|uniref:Uncharacterized protein n=1 Tax=Jannaschia aquimarina TaxID=935700 RepID=A0A0D1CLU5_9RHOB|nr:hypothetical protein [Jannaschia aquimarina]KIT15747.1 hypothetical protein jaqu_24880 [Jannaschia aquimarina]SNT32107.1 hypothetical protein SAMN05421775_11144 [Jannaschia aquimarina]